jgi:flagella basal body P-ring formation protein FlgA
MTTPQPKRCVPILLASLAVMLWVPSVSTAATATAANVQSLEKLRHLAVETLQERYAAPGSRVVVSARAFNPRLKLASCPTPLRATVQERSAPASLMTVAVQCTQPGAWIVRVPLRLQLFRPVLVTTHSLRRSDGIRAGDVRAVERDVTQLGYGYIESLDQITGRILARPLVAGSVLTPTAMGGRRMVRAGDHVQLVARLDGIEVRAEGVALGGGDNGARLRVRNESSGRIIDAMVSAPGVVVTLP